MLAFTYCGNPAHTLPEELELDDELDVDDKLLDELLDDELILEELLDELITELAEPNNSISANCKIAPLLLFKLKR